MMPTTRIRERILFAALLPLTAALGCASHAADRPWTIDASRYAVAADHADASRAGAEILAKGGNAVDAAVATSFALAVVRPESCGLGGGGFMLIHRPGESPVAIDYREQAPAATRLERYRNANGKLDPTRIRRGGLSVGIPGTVRGLLHAFEHYGSGRITREQVIAPALRLARQPLVADEHLANAINEFRAACAKRPAMRSRYRELADTLLTPDGESRRQIDRSAIVETLQAIADRGTDGFYDGPVAQRLADAAQADHGALSRDDLAAYRVREFKPIQQSCFGYEVLGMPPPSSGGAVICETLHILESFGESRLREDYERDYIDKAVSPEALHALPGTPGSIEYVRPGEYLHLLIEALKPAFADRAQWLGDASPDVATAVTHMLDQSRARRIAAGIDDRHAAPWTKYRERAVMHDDGGTSHLSVIDENGMAVACTESVNLLFGSRLLVPETGVILNDTMDDFALDTKTPNAFGLRQSERNIVRPGARPLSSMSPTIVLKDGRVRLVAGASGGPRIITSTLQTMLHVMVGDRQVADAVAAPRVHHQWLPDVVRYQPSLSAALQESLRRRGHKLKVRKSIGDVQAVERLPDGTLRAACDPDKGGRPAGK